MTANHNSLMGNLALKHEEVFNLIGGSPVHYVDIPMHENIGDLLIMLGTLEFMKKKSVKIKQVSSYFNFNRARVDLNDVVVFHGGGNLGDLYEAHQDARERYIPNILSNRVIIMPQTIHFIDEAKYKQCCNIFSSHPDLHIFVRDRASFELAKPMSKNIYLVPDMAHQLWPVKFTRDVSGKKKLGILRTDIEKKSNIKVCEFDEITDWPKLVGNRKYIGIYYCKLLKFLNRAGMDGYLVTASSMIWIKWAKVLVNDAIRLYSNASHITTDRLHGHILACLMNIPHTVYNNSYGKNYSYINEWTKASDIVSRQDEHKLNCCTNQLPLTG